MCITASCQVPSSAAALTGIDSQVKIVREEHLLFGDSFGLLTVCIAVFAAATRSESRYENAGFACHVIHYTPGWLSPPFLIY